MKLIPGITFSWKRAIGITRMKQKISKATGIPLSKQGMERKIGATLIDIIKKGIRR